MIFVSSPCALETFCARSTEVSASARMRGRNFKVAPLDLLFLPRMPRIGLFVAAEIPNLPNSDSRIQASRPSQIVGCVGVGIARKLGFSPWREKSPRAPSRADRVSGARIKRKNKEGQTVMTQHVGELNPPVRLMLTPGPSSIDPRVYRAMATPLVGHMDPWFKGCMEETQILMRQIFQTENRITMPLSASGSGGIEGSVLNTLEEGDEGIVAVNGLFSDRMFEIAQRASAKITKVEVPYGNTVDAEDVRRAGKGRKIKIIGLAQGETSSGVLTQLADFRKVADEMGALLGGGPRG